MHGFYCACNHKYSTSSILGCCSTANCQCTQQNSTVNFNNKHFSKAESAAFRQVVIHSNTSYCSGVLVRKEKRLFFSPHFIQIFTIKCAGTRSGPINGRTDCNETEKSKCDLNLNTRHHMHNLRLPCKFPSRWQQKHFQADACG